MCLSVKVVNPSLTKIYLCAHAMLLESRVTQDVLSVTVLVCQENAVFLMIGQHEGL